MLFTQTTLEVNGQWVLKHLDESCNSYNATIEFGNDSVGFFMSSNSVILKSGDAGETWTSKDPGIEINIRDFQFISDSIIYAVGDCSPNPTISKLIRSTDCGNTWDSITSFRGKQLNSLHFFNKDTGMLAGYDGIYRTTDACNSWDTTWSVTQFGYKYGELKQICFPTIESAYAIGSARTYDNDVDLWNEFLLKTDDSGLSWDTLITFPYSLESIYFLNNDTGFIGTGNNRMLKTMDGGITWQETLVSDNSIHSIYAIHFTSHMKGFIAGHPSAYILESPTSFFVASTDDGGNTWESYDTIGIPVHSVYFLSDTVGFVAGERGLIMKSNGNIKGWPPDYPWHLFSHNYSSDPDVEDTDIRAFPVPTTGSLSIKLSNNLAPAEQIKIIDSTGRVLKTLKLDSGDRLIRLELSDFAAGIYFLQVHTSNKIEVLKVLKE